MNKLTKEQFERARQFLKTRARKLERALFEYEFESGGQEPILNRISGLSE